MPSTALKYATSVSDTTGVGTKTWSNPSNAVGNNTTDATNASVDLSLTSTSHWLVATFAHGLSSSDTINGVAVAIRRYATLNDSTAPQDNSVKLVKDGTISGNDKASATTWPQTGAWSSDYGSSSDLWGISSLTGSNTIGVAVSVKANDPNDLAYVTAFRATFTYTTSSGVKFRRTVNGRIGSRSSM